MSSSEAPFTCAEHLDATEPVGPAPTCRPRGDADGCDRESEREDVGEHVTGVGQERERAGDYPEGDLDHHHARKQRQGNEQ